MATRPIDGGELWLRAQQRVDVEIPDALAELCIAGVRVLWSCVEESDAFDARGRLAAEQELVSTVVGWITHYKDLRSHPRLESVALEKPLFIVGYSRTGSTLLHNLLALDPKARAPRLWELWYPAPPPRAETYASDPRIGVARRRLAALRRAAPAYFEAHPMMESAPEECGWIIWHNEALAARYFAKRYWSWIAGLDREQLIELYSIYKQTVQLLNLEFSGGHWLAKCETHLHYLPALLHHFPDARIVRLHRDPCRAIPSVCALYGTLRGMHSMSHPDRDLGPLFLDMFRDGAEKMMTTALDPAQVIDVTYDELIADSVATVRRIYAQLGYSLSAPFEDALRMYVAQSAGSLRSPHRYSLAQFGLSAGHVREVTAAYQVWLGERAEIRWGDSDLAVGVAS